MQKALSFGMENEEDAEEVVFISKKKLSKNPTVDTSFLPDRERDTEMEKRKQELTDEWLKQQEIIKNEVSRSLHAATSLLTTPILQMMEVVYSYWDGSGHRKAMQIKKGTTVGRFLELVKQQLSAEFPEVRGFGVDNMIYVKEDLIIPHVSQPTHLLYSNSSCMKSGFLMIGLWSSIFLSTISL